MHKVQTVPSSNWKFENPHPSYCLKRKFDERITTQSWKKTSEKKSNMEEDADLEVEYCPESNITEDESQPKETFVVVRETAQEILETHEKENKKSVKPNSI